MYDYYEIRELMDMNNENKKLLKLDKILNKLRKLDNQFEEIKDIQNLNTILLHKLSYEENKCNSDYDSSEEEYNDSESEEELVEIQSNKFNPETKRYTDSDTEEEEEIILHIPNVVDNTQEEIESFLEEIDIITGNLEIPEIN
tara:strand:- start:1179 stop:1607 length:429 start_codon:yes stop_codon:yes gene_type:complete